MNNSIRKRTAAFALLVCLLAVSFFSASLSVAHISHEHNESGANGCCAICAKIQNAENLFKQLITALGGEVFNASLLFGSAAVLLPITISITAYTPVKLKIRMNN